MIGKQELLIEFAESNDYANFARPQGAKDKKPRKRRGEINLLGRKFMTKEAHNRKKRRLLGTVAGGLGAAGLGALALKGKIKMPKQSSISSALQTKQKDIKGSLDNLMEKVKKEGKKKK